jgi:tetratricopeptide (TPR) repeat protein
MTPESLSKVKSFLSFDPKRSAGKAPRGGKSAAKEPLAPEDAALLFERAGDFVQAGEAARAARDLPRAAQYFKQAGAWLQAVRCYEEAGKLREALQTVEEGCLSLERAVGRSQTGAERLDELTALRIDLLVRMGRGDTATRLLAAMRPSPRTAALLELAGRYTEAIECHLQLGLTEEASRLAARSPERERLQALIFLRTGRPAEAGDLLARIGRPGEAAEAYEKAGHWARAAYRWEAAEVPLRAAQAYEKAGRPRDAARCYEAAGLPRQAAEVSAPAPAPKPQPPREKLRTLTGARRYLETGNKTGAASLLLQMRPDEPGFAEGALLLAPLLIEEGFGQQALDRLLQIPREEALRVEMEIEYWAGRSHQSLGRRDDAILCFERVVGRAPDHRDAREHLLRLQSPTIPIAEAGEAAPPPAAPAAAGPPVVSGRIAGRYEILTELGRGGMGRVYKALDLELDEIVAIKTLLAPEVGLKEESRLLREVQICRRISHPNVVRVYDIGRFESGLFVTMEHIEGTPLETIIEQESPLPFARIRGLLAEIAAGLQEAHTQGVVHRDLKPANIMVTESRLKILDFGIASMAGLGARLTQAGFVLGTPMYMSPDQLLGREPDGRSDLYSLGLLAYTLISGRDPFEATEATVLALKQLHESPPDVRKHRPETPEPWVALIERLYAKDPEGRFQTAGEVLEALAGLPEG